MKFDRMCSFVERLARRGTSVPVSQAKAIPDEAIASLGEEEADKLRSFLSQAANVSVRQWASELHKHLSRAPLIHFPIEPIGAGYDDMKAIRERLMLPFNEIVLEDKHDCSYLARPFSVMKQEDKSPVGLTEEPDSCVMYVRFGWRQGVEVLSSGTLMGIGEHIDKETGKPAIGGAADFSVLIMQKGLGPFHVSYPSHDAEESRNFARDGYICLSEVVQMNDPHKYWMVKKEAEMAAPRKQRDIPRSPQRIRYIVMESGVVEKALRIPNPENKGTVAAHRRRAHWRYLASEKYKRKRGQLVRVSESWVGPREFAVEGVRYEVCPEL